MAARGLLAAVALAAIALPALADEEAQEWPALTEPGWDAATVFAVLAKNEWCPGGSVHVDLWTGDYVLMPRLPRPACTDPASSRHVLTGRLTGADLADLRAAYRRTIDAGLATSSPPDVIIIDNGGPELLVVTGPTFNEITPHDLARWTPEASALHGLLFDLFGEEHLPADFAEDAGRQKANAND